VVGLVRLVCLFVMDVSSIMEFGGLCMSRTVFWVVRKLSTMLICRSCLKCAVLSSAVGMMS